MKRFLIIFFYPIFSRECLADEFDDKFCLDSGDYFLTQVLSNFEAEAENFTVKFYLSTNEKREPVDIAANNLSAVENSSFNPHARTYVIIHGYVTHGADPWIIELKDSLLDLKPSNIIIVNWSAGAYNGNYLVAVKNTRVVAKQTIELLFALQKKLLEDHIFSDSDTKWHKLRFIGHSLGAHICGQTSYGLSNHPSSVFIIKRISGLDPAKPCFRTATTLEKFRLDKNDAQLVDVIHTQAKLNDFSYGTEEQIGHLDFFVNGGITQPECIKSIFSVFPSVCSHRSAFRYFIETVKKANDETCNLLGFPWDGSFDKAKEIMKSVLDHEKCEDCPKMGIKTSKKDKHGKYLVLTGAEPSYCEYEDSDKMLILRTLEQLNYRKRRASKHNKNIKTNFVK